MERMIVSWDGSNVHSMARIRRTLCAVLLVGLLLAGGGVGAAARTASAVRLDTLDHTLLVQLNGVRRVHALSPLKASGPLFDAADRHTGEMGRAGYFSHASLDRTPFWRRIERSYPSAGRRCWSVGEVLLWASPTVSPSEAIRMWMNSPAHRANLLDPAWREVGIAASHFGGSTPGIFAGQSVTVVTADFGVRSRKSPAARSCTFAL